jgi:COP9 signalosome complex subunit 2
MWRQDAHERRCVLDDGVALFLLTLRPENWKDAQSDFFESFRNYDEAGSLHRIQVLKYLVLTTMLMGSDINPFDSQETKPYKNDPRIAAMTELVDAYQRDDIDQYGSVLQKNRDLLADPFIAENIDEVTRNMRTKAVVKLVAPYTRFRLDFIAKRLSISIPEVQDIVGFLILDKKLHGKINQDAGTVEIENRADLDRTRAVASWTGAIQSLASLVLNESEGFKVDESGAGATGLDADLREMSSTAFSKTPFAAHSARRKGRGRG